MRATRTSSLLLVALSVALLAWGALRWWTAGGHQPPALPWSAPSVLGLLAAFILVAGWPVRRWTRGERDRSLDPLRAARTVVLAKAAQYGGALFTGWYLAQALALVPTTDVEPHRALLLRAAVSLLTAVAVWVAGWLVERWCRVSPQSDDDPTDPAPA